jgi:hypothetical protein
MNEQEIKEIVCGEVNWADNSVLFVMQDGNFREFSFPNAQEAQSYYLSILSQIDLQ